MSVTVGTVAAQGSTNLGGGMGMGSVEIKKLTCSTTCTLDFMSPLGQMFKIDNLTTESTKGIYFNGKLTSTQDIAILKKIYLDNTLALNTLQNQENWSIVQGT